jgi:succinate-semialdehyde dehydrogenase/glutarate-semialdehyde dehydrogenase
MATTYSSAAMYIDGHWTQGESGEREDIINPATEAVIGTVPHASLTDLDRALDAAQRGFRLWRSTPIDNRTRILLKAAALLRERAQQVAEIMTQEQGKPVTEAKAEVLRVAGTLQWDAEEGRRAYGRIIPSEPGTQLSVFREPVGPVAAFTPWNFPAGSPMRKIAAALSAGCSIVIKPSEETPGTACEIVKCFEEAGVPAGVLNMVFGVPAMISKHLIASPIIRFVAFTGSIEVGKHLAGLAAAVMKPNIMELGGHAPVVVCEDADPEEAARRSAAGKFVNAGQVCTSPSRFVVHRSLKTRFTEAFIEAAKRVVVGNGLDAKTTMGPLANARRLTSVENLVRDASECGADILLGGKRIGERGYFFAPTVMTNVSSRAKLMHIEPFGPVAPILEFDALDEAIELANSLPYGLAAYGFTERAETANELARRLEAGILSINHTSGSVSEAPSGGVKESGYGREGGSEGLEGYLITKRLSHRLSGKASR